MNQEKDAKIIDFLSETGLYINIPIIILDYLYSSAAKLSKISIRLYFEYYRAWQTNDYQCSISSSVLADKLHVTKTTIKKANKSLVDAGLIKRNIRTINNGGCRKTHISSLTYPAVPENLLNRIKNAPTRKSYQDPVHGEIESLDQLLAYTQENSSSLPPPSTFYETTLSKLQKLAEEQPRTVSAHQETLESIAAEITWSICEPDGQMAGQTGYQSDVHRLNAALALVKRGAWERPKKMPQNYLVDPPKPNMSTNSHSEKLENPEF